MKRVQIFTIISFFTILTVSRFSYAQSHDGYRCGTTDALRKLYAEYPQLEADYENFVKENKSGAKALNNKTRIFIIPVIFHVLHQYGDENISDEQIINAVELLNLDYRKMNFDTSDIVPEFRSLAADCRIEFRLATKDPSGNCTNGIERINSHETNVGDDYSKLHQWSRSNYLNIWVVNSMSPGVAGYSYYPTAVAGVMSFADGVIVLHDYVGSIGTSNYFRSKTLTHEIGHYLGLAHPWGSNNNPGMACGDDGIEDTPVSIGWQSCQLTANDICEPGTPENVQNYMEYSYCTRMFTKGQAFFMNLTLVNSMASRNYLSSDSNLIYTGALQSAPLCSPQPDFKPSKPIIRTGVPVTFNNYTWKAPADAYLWSFPGGNPSTSTATSPSVSYDAPGWYNVTLTASNASGSVNKTINQSIYVVPSWSDISGPFSETFESSDLSSWAIMNPENNEASWRLTDKSGYQSNKCLMLNNVAGINDAFYFYRLGGNTDAFITNSYDLSTTSAAKLSFSHSCATFAGESNDIQEVLNVYASSDYCSNWTLIKTLTGIELANAGYCSEAYIPQPNTAWTTTTVTIPNGIARKQNVRFKFEYIATDLSNNIYIDNIGVEGVLGIQSEPLLSEVNIYPNPVGNNQVFTLTYNTLTPSTIDISISDIIGKEICRFSEKTSEGPHNKEINCKELNMRNGLYLVKIKTGTQEVTRKLMIL